MALVDDWIGCGARRRRGRGVREHGRRYLRFRARPASWARSSAAARARARRTHPAACWSLRGEAPARSGAAARRYRHVEAECAPDARDARARVAAGRRATMPGPEHARPPQRHRLAFGRRIDVSDASGRASRARPRAKANRPALHLRRARRRHLLPCRAELRATAASSTRSAAPSLARGTTLADRESEMQQRAAAPARDHVPPLLWSVEQPSPTTCSVRAPPDGDAGMDVAAARALIVWQDGVAAEAAGSVHAGAARDAARVSLRAGKLSSTSARVQAAADTLDFRGAHARAQQACNHVDRRRRRPLRRPPMNAGAQAATAGRSARQGRGRPPREARRCARRPAPRRRRRDERRGRARRPCAAASLPLLLPAPSHGDGGGRCTAAAAEHCMPSRRRVPHAARAEALGAPRRHLRDLLGAPRTAPILGEARARAFCRGASRTDLAALHASPVWGHAPELFEFLGGSAAASAAAEAAARARGARPARRSTRAA